MDIAGKIVDLLSKRAPAASICPSDVARVGRLCLFNPVSGRRRLFVIRKYVQKLNDRINTKPARPTSTNVLKGTGSFELR